TRPLRDDVWPRPGDRGERGDQVAIADGPLNGIEELGSLVEELARIGPDDAPHVDRRLRADSLTVLLDRLPRENRGGLGWIEEILVLHSERLLEDLVRVRRSLPVDFPAEPDLGENVRVGGANVVRAFLCPEILDAGGAACLGVSGHCALLPPDPGRPGSPVGCWCDTRRGPRVRVPAPRRGPGRSG